MVLYTGDDRELYYLKASFSGGDITAVMLNENIKGISETFFIGSTTETVGAETEVYASYTVGWDDQMSSNLGNINGGIRKFGIILPSHKSTSCLTDSSGSLSISV